MCDPKHSTTAIPPSRTAENPAQNLPPNHSPNLAPNLAPASPLSLLRALPPLRDVIRRHGLRAKKSLGQNFILDLNLTSAIARIAGPLEGRTVVEIGPGPGGLTRGLLLEGAAHVITIERDERVLPAIKEIALACPGQLSVHNMDALQANWPQLIAQLPRAPGEQTVSAEANKPIICANLPYGIATKLLIGWLSTDAWPPWYDKMVLMFQKEVAERIVAKPNCKAYGRLAVISQWRSSPRIAMTLPPEAFTPAPKVSSAVVEFMPRALPPAHRCKGEILGAVTAAAFGQRRKMLRTSLKQLTPMPELLLQKAGIDPTARAETLSVEDFVSLAVAYDG